MRSRHYETGTGGRCFPAARGARWGRLLPGLLLSTALAAGAPARAGVNVSPLSIDFGSQMVNGPGAERLFQIQNMTLGPILISSIETIGTDPEDFIPPVDSMSACIGTLAAGITCTARVVFTPSQLGPRSATLVVITDAAPPIMVPLSGYGTVGSPPPTITCPANISVTAAAGQTTAVVNIGTATATGSSVTVTGTRSDGAALTAPYSVGATIITWTATDGSGNQAACTQTVTVQAAAQPPQIHCPPDQTVAVSGSSSTASINPGLATSTSAGVIIVGARSDGMALAAPYPIGTTTITWTATDAAGNAATCTQTITVQAASQTLQPTITCAANMSVVAAGQTTAVVNIGMPTATGNGVTVTGTRSDGAALTNPYPVGTTLITWIATDRSGNRVTCTQTITVQAAAQSLEIDCPPNQNVVVGANNTTASLNPSLATSASAGVTIVGVRSDGKALAAPYPVGTTTITWTAADVSGNEGACTQTITVGPGVISPPAPGIVINPNSANPHLDGVIPAQGPLYQRAIIHGSGFADLQGTSFVMIGGRHVTVLAWSANAIGIVVNPLAFNPAPLALNAAYPVQVFTPASGRQSNTVEFFLAEGAPADAPVSAGTAPSSQPHFGSFQRNLFCPGDTVLFLGAGFGPSQGTGYVTVTVPLADPNGHVVHQVFAVPALSWSENAIGFALNLPSAAIPGTYKTTVHRSDGKTASGAFTVGARDANGDCVAGD